MYMNFQEMGIKADIEDKSLILGNRKLMEANSIDISNIIPREEVQKYY